MGIYQYTDPQTGQSFNFEHAGDAPTDEDFAFIANYIDQQRADYAQKYEQYFGEEFDIDDETAVRRGLRRGGQQIKGALGEALGTAGEQFGLDMLAEYGQGIEEKARQRLGELSIDQPDRLQSTDVDSVGSALTYAGEVIGEQIPQLGLGLGAAAVGSVLAPAAPFIAGATAAGLSTAPILFGNDIQRQEDEVAAGRKDRVDVGDALTATFGQATLEGIADKLLLGGLLRPLGSSIFTRTLSRAGGGATTEGLTEVGQQMMERAQAGLDIDSDDAIAEYREAAIAGGLIGGGTRATFGAFQGDGTTEIPPQTETPSQTETETVVAPEAETAEQQALAAIAANPSLIDPNTDEDFIREELDVEYSPEVIEAIIVQRRRAQAQPETATETTEIDAATDIQTQTAAEATEEANAEDATPIQGAAQQTTTERAEAEQAVQQDIDEQTAKDKTAEYLKKETSSVDTPKGADIQVKDRDTLQAEMLDTAKPAEATKITKEFLTQELGIQKLAHIVRGKERSIVGLDVNDPKVRTELQSYVRNGGSAKAKVQEFLNTLEVTDDARPRAEGTGTSTGSSQPSVVGSGRADSRVDDTVEPTAPDAGPVGRSMLDTDGVDAAAGVQRDTLEAEPEVEETADERAVEAVRELANRVTAKPVDVPATPAMQQAAIPGQTTGAAAQQIPAPVAPAPRVEQVQAAPVPQEELQAAEQARNLTAQSALNQLYQKQPEAVQSYHDLSVADERDAADTTTALDKEAVVELLSMKKKDLDDNQKAARLYFERFRRPADALAEIGALTVVGPKKTFAKDYTEEQLPFYKGMTQGSALNARKWVFDNMSPQANQIMRDARVQAKRDTTEFKPSDKVILAKKFAKKVLNDERDAYNKQLTREANEFTEASRLAAANKKTQLDQTMAATTQENILVDRDTGREAIRVTKPVKGKTAFESYLIQKGYALRKPRKKETAPASEIEVILGQTANIVYDPQDNNRVLSAEEVFEQFDDYRYSREQGFLLEEATDFEVAYEFFGLDQSLLPSMRSALQQGRLKETLQGVAATNPFEKVRQVAGKLSLVVGDTQVQVVDNLSGRVGRTAAGLFDPETNTIQIDASRGMNVHTLLHEMTHAATHAALTNKSLPEVKQLQSIYDAATEQIGEVYGTRNLDEFVAEAFSNPEFQLMLAALNVDGSQKSGWEMFTDAVKRVVRKIMGLAPRAPENAADATDILIENLLAPSPASRTAPAMLLEAQTKEGSAGLLQKMVNIDAKEKALDVADTVYNEGIAKTARSWTLNTLPVNILSDVASKKIPFAKELNTIINRMSGALRQKSEMLDSMTYNLKKWQSKNQKHAKTLNNLIPRSTYLQIDPSRTDNKYIDTIKQDPEKSREYKELRKAYLSMDKKGQDFYRQLRNYFQDTYNDILEALDARLEATITDPDARKTAFARLRELLQKDSGIITPYFPLQRKGNYRLAYTAPDPDTGQPELFVEYYPTLRKAQQARDMVSGVGGTDVEITESSKPMNFDRAPSTSFVRNVLETVQLQRANFKTDEEYKMAMQAMVDLALDAMPERSFMQNFRRRKGIRGFIGDTTPTGIGGQVFDAHTMLKEKGRDLNRQLVQMRSAAEIEGFRRQLADPEAGYLTNPETAMIAQKLDQIAKFAASPNVPRWSQVATSTGFAMTMGLNISSALITFFDVAMSAMPILAGKHGISNVTRAYSTASKALLGAPTKRMVMVTGPDGQPVEQEVDMGYAGKTIANYTPEQLRERFGNLRMDILVEKGLDQAQFNQSITQENLEIGRDPGSAVETMNRMSSFMFHHSERFNRETTLVSAYMLEVQKLQKEKGQLSDADYEQAAQSAIDDTEFSLGATAAAGRPIIAQTGIGNILFLFKRFAISKYYMMLKLAQEAAKGDKVARAGLRNFLVMTGLMSGLGGMPLMGAFGALFNMLRDDDEDDFESELRKLVGEGIYGGLANEILGIDVANRISMNSLLYRAPIVEKDQSALWTLAEQLGGPVLGVGLQWERGIKDIADGEVRRGIESLAPAAIRNGLKSIRFAGEGATTRRGDPITEDINPYNIVMQAAGFAPQGYIQALEFNKNNRRRQEAINSRRGKLLRRRNIALREGDIDEVRRIDQQIQKFNEGLPEGAEKSRITADTKKRSQASFGRTTEKMRGGMTYTPFMERSLQEYDQGFSF
jgi:hypothetical protein